MYILRLDDDVIMRRRRGLSAVHSGAHFLKKKKIETFEFSSSVFDRVFLFVTFFFLFHFPPKNPIRSPSCSFLSLPSYKFNSFFIDSKCRWIEGLAGATDLKQIHSLLDVFCWLNQRLYYSIRRDSMVVVVVVASSIWYRIDIIFLRWRFGKRLADHRTATPPLFTHSPSFISLLLFSSCPTLFSHTF